MKELRKKSNYLESLHNYLYIKKEKIFYDLEIQLTNLLNQIVLTGRNSFILLFINQYFIKNDNFFTKIQKDDFNQFQEIISFLIPEKTSYNAFARQNISSYQIIRCQDLIRNTLSSLKIFSFGIHHYFLPKKQPLFNSEYFGTVIYPSLFGYFSFTEMIEGAYQLLMMTMIYASYEKDRKTNNTDHLLNGSLNDVEGIMFSTFFNGFPHFIHSFCKLFLYLVNKFNTSFHNGSVHEFICESLEYSSQYLTPYHIKIIKYVNKYRNFDFFMNFFMIRVLQNNLALYLESNYEMKCDCVRSKKDIMDAFQCFTTKLNPEFRTKFYSIYIQKIIGRKSFSFTYQSIEKKLHRYKFFLFISGFGERMILSIMKSSNCFNASLFEENLIQNNSLKPYLIEFTTQYHSSLQNLNLMKEIDRNIQGVTKTIKLIQNKQISISQSRERSRVQKIIVDDGDRPDNGEEHDDANDCYEEFGTYDSFMSKYNLKNDKSGFILADIKSTMQNQTDSKGKNTNHNYDDNSSNYNDNNNNDNNNNDNNNNDNNNNDNNNNDNNNNDNNNNDNTNYDDNNSNYNDNNSNTNYNDNNSNYNDNNSNTNYNDNNSNTNYNDNNSNTNYNDNDEVCCADESMLREFGERKNGDLMKFLCELSDSNLNQRNISLFQRTFINDYEERAEMIEKFISVRINQSKLNLIYFTFKQRQEIFLSHISSIITSSFTFSNNDRRNNCGYSKQYINHFQYFINNSESSLLNPYFQLMSYKEVHFSKKFGNLLHEKQLLQKFKIYFQDEISNADRYINEFNFQGIRNDIINSLVLTLKNVYQVPLNDQLLVISKVTQKISQITRSLKNNIINAEEKIFLYAYLKSGSAAVLPAFLIYSFLFHHNQLFSNIMNEFDKNIKKSIDLMENAIVNLFLEIRNDLQLLIIDFISC